MVLLLFTNTVSLVPTQTVDHLSAVVGNSHNNFQHNKDGVAAGLVANARCILAR